MLTSARWQAFWDWPLTIAAVTFLVVYSWLVIGDLQGSDGQLAQTILTITWVIFCVDYVGRLILADKRWSWFLHHLLDLAIVVLPMLRPLRLLRLFVLLAIFQRFAGKSLRGRVVVYAAASTVLLVFVSALAVLDAERHEHGASIRSFGESLWWACATITTVGYGDAAPVSLTGRVIAVALMVGGIALLGTVTATLASWIVQRVSAEDEANQAATRRQVQALTEELKKQQQQDQLPPGPRSEPGPVQRQRRRRSPAVSPRSRPRVAGTRQVRDGLANSPPMNASTQPARTTKTP